MERCQIFWNACGLLMQLFDPDCSNLLFIIYILSSSGQTGVEIIDIRYSSYRSSSECLLGQKLKLGLETGKPHILNRGFRICPIDVNVRQQLYWRYVCSSQIELKIIKFGPSKHLLPARHAVNIWRRFYQVYNLRWPELIRLYNCILSISFFVSAA